MKKLMVIIGFLMAIAAVIALDLANPTLTNWLGVIALTVIVAYLMVRGLFAREFKLCADARGGLVMVGSVLVLVFSLVGYVGGTDGCSVTLTLIGASLASLALIPQSERQETCF